MPDPPATAGQAAQQKLSAEQLDALAELPPETIRALGDRPSATRRGVLAGGGAGLAAALLGGYAATEPAQAAAQDSGGEGDVGSESTPFEGFADGLAMVTQSVNTSTTINKPVVLADSAPGSLTLTIDAALEGPSGFSQQIVVIDQTGNAGTNSITVENSSNVTVATIDSDNAELVIRWDSGEWITKRFIPTVDAGTVTADQINLTNYFISNGDFVSKFSTGAASQSTASSTYSGNTIFRTKLSGLPAGATLAVLVTGRAASGTDQIDVRVQDTFSTETWWEKTFTEDTTFTEAQTFTVGSRGSRSIVALQIKNADNATTVDLLGPAVALGVKV